MGFDWIYHWYDYRSGDYVPVTDTQDERLR